MSQHNRFEQTPDSKANPIIVLSPHLSRPYRGPRLSRFSLSLGWAVVSVEDAGNAIVRSNDGGRILFFAHPPVARVVLRSRKRSFRPGPRVQSLSSPPEIFSGESQFLYPCGTLSGVNAIHTEKYFEDDIVADLTEHGWLAGDPAAYDAARALYPDDALWWVQYAYPREWEKFAQQNPGNPAEAFLARLTHALEKQGSQEMQHLNFAVIADEAHSSQTGKAAASLKQAIEEGFILDVLKGYIPYKVAYKLAHNGMDYDEDEVDKSEASKALSRWVRLHPYNIAQKVQIVVEHFREHVADRLEGTAKAMVVTGSRKEAVRYKLAMDTYIRAKRYMYGTLVAFSGEVNDKESSVLPLTEHTMNPRLQGEDIHTVFDRPDYQVLIVANKFQTGFDQPKLVAMYVDKRLSGVATVQTLSRLNRTCPGKDWTAVLDFVNDPEAVLDDFQRYYRGAVLPTGADPQMVIDLQEKLDAQGIYHASEVDAFAEAYYSTERQGRTLTQRQLQGKVSPIMQRFSDRLQAARNARDDREISALTLFVKDLESFCSLYDFLSQIVPFSDPDLEKRYLLFRHLIHPLRETLRTSIPDDGGIDLSQIHLTHYAIHLRRGVGDTGGLYMDPDGISVLEAPSGQGTGEAHTKEQILLSELVEQLNRIFEGELSDADMISYAEATVDKVMEDSEVVLQARNNDSLDQFANGRIRDAIPSAIVHMMTAHTEMTQQVMANTETMKQFAKLITGMVYGKVREKSA